VSPDGTALGLAIANVHDVFAGMAANPDEVGCLACYSPGDMEMLRRSDVPVPDDLVASVALEVPDHWDDHAAVLRRVLPQAVDKLVLNSLDHGLTASRLVAAGWTEWPEEQVAAIRQFLGAWWDWSLRQESPPTKIWDVFECCATATSEVTTWLARWDAAAAIDTNARRALAECFDWWWYDLQAGVSPFHWWHDARERAASDELNTWLARTRHGVPNADDGR